MKSHRVADLVFILLFLTIVAVVTAVTVFTPAKSTSEYENRNLAKRPVLDPAIMLDDGYFLEWEAYFTDHAAAREWLLRAKTIIDLELLGRPVVNGVIASGDLYLEYFPFSEPDEQWWLWQSNRMMAELSSLRDVISSYGGDFYYVAVPSHETWFADDYPWYTNNNDIKMDFIFNAFIEGTSKAGINVIFPFLGLTSEDTLDGVPLYFASDHHYSFAGAYLTYRSIVERINGDGKYSLPMLDYGDFEFYALPNPFMGSQLRKLMNVPPLNERASIAILAEDIPFTRADSGVQFDPPRVYRLPDDPDSIINYELYMGGDSAETVIETNRDLPSVLVFGDSMTNAVECLLYTSAGEFRSIDLRHFSDMALSEYVEIFKPDIVICMRGYANLVNPDGNGTVMPKLT